MQSSSNSHLYYAKGEFMTSQAFFISCAIKNNFKQDVFFQEFQSEDQEF